MRQLTSLDAQFLALETPRQAGHVSGLAILDDSERAGGRLDIQAIQGLIEERLPLLPPLRWRLAEVPLGLDYPYWVEDEHFDINFHVRDLALAAPGDDEKLAEQVARIFSRPLDRSRPLWEMYLIHGLQSGHVAVMTKIHHAVIDGMSGAEILGVMLDHVPEGRELPAPPPRTTERCPGSWEMLGRGLLGVPRYPVRALKALPRTLPNLEEVALFDAVPGAKTAGRAIGGLQRTLFGGPPVKPRHLHRPPHTSFNGRVSPHRRFAFGQLALDDVKAVKNRYGCTVNDVVVALCAGAVRRWLLEHDELPEQPLVAQVPVSVRGSDEMGTYGNRILLMSAPLFTDEADPVQRLQRTHEALREMKDRHRALPAELLQDVNHFIPPALFARAARTTFALATGLGRPTWNLVISNVPGPQMPLYMAGARVVANYPVSVITDGMGLNITVQSYDGHMDFGIVADREQMADVWCLIGWLEDGLRELLPTRSPNGRSAAARSESRSTVAAGAEKKE